MNDVPSIAAELFSEIMDHPGHTDSVAFLKRMVNSIPPTMESEHRDFKGGTSQGVALTDGEVKKIWSEALAGFATTSGGVLVWGLDARKQAGDTVDRVVALNLVPDPSGLKSRLQQLLPQATDPPIPGVRVESVVDPTQNGRGFVVCFVPESSYKPHRTEMAGKKWVMRISDSFVDVPPSVLRSLFFPHRHSYIFLRAYCKTECTDAMSRAGELKAMFSLRLCNEGPATATDLLVIVQPVAGMEFHAIPLWKHLNTPAGFRFIYEQSFHPGQMTEMPPASIMLPFLPRRATELGRGGDVSFDFQLYATDQPPFQICLQCAADDIKYQKDWMALPTPLQVTRHR
jgi:hypothetical protein